MLPPSMMMPGPMDARTAAHPNGTGAGISPWFQAGSWPGSPHPSARGSRSAVCSDTTALPCTEIRGSFHAVGGHSCRQAVVEARSTGLVDAARRNEADGERVSGLGAIASSPLARLGVRAQGKEHPGLKLRIEV